MLWISLAIFSYFLFAVSFVADRYILAGPLPNPLVYTFYMGVTGIVAVAFIPFGFFVPSIEFIVLSLIAGVISVVALHEFYRLLFHDSVERAAPLVGAFLPIMTAILLLFIYSSQEIGLTKQLQIAFFFLIPATILLSVDHRGDRYIPSINDLIGAIITAFLFASSFVMAKIVYENITFINGFIWMRFGGFMTALALLFARDVRQVVFAQNPLIKRGVYLPMVIGKGSGALGFFAQQYAIAIARAGEIAIINALQGTQYLFLLIFVVLLGFRKSQILHESLRGRALFVRGTGVVLLAIGLFILLNT